MCVSAPSSPGCGHTLASIDINDRRSTMPRGASPKREAEFKKLETEFKKEHRYPGREEEVASRIVNKQRAEHGETRQSAHAGSKQSAKK
jgi:hypothetical protein